MYNIEYVTEMIVKTAVVYVVGPRNMFAIHHREVNETTERGEYSRATHVALRNDDETNESHDVFCDLDVSETRFKFKIKQLLTWKGNELNQTLLKSVKN